MHLSGLDQIYILNVRSFEKRRIHVKKELDRFGLEAQFIFDWDISDLTGAVIKKFFRTDSGLSLAQKSLALKHITALQKIIDNEQETALILEDDVVLADNFVDGVNRSLSERRLYPKENVIFIGCGGNFYTPNSERRLGKSLYVNKRGRFADSYIVGKNTAQLRLNWLLDNKIDKPIDNQFEYIDNLLGITMLWLEDPVVEQGSKNGLFKTQLEPSSPRLIQKLKFSWEKIRRKYLYQIWR